MKHHVVVLSGAGISAESGLKTFRDMGGLWENYAIEEVATPQAWQKNPSLVQAFYNERRRQAAEAQPNAAHQAIAALESWARVTVVTQNVDDLHERAGSTQVVHLHGELRKVRSVQNPSLILDIGGRALGDDERGPDGHILRPHIVWFGEEVPLLPMAAEICQTADFLLIVGTSLQVYPAAGLVHEVSPTTPRFVIDPGKPSVKSPQTYYYPEPATTGVPRVIDYLKTNY